MLDNTELSIAPPGLSSSTVAGRRNHGGAIEGLRLGEKHVRTVLTNPTMRQL
jgi:hypothetical protein